MEACSLDKPHVFNKNAKLVESRLYNGLLLLFTDGEGKIDYDSVHVHYTNALNIMHEDDKNSKIVLDDCNQPTLESYLSTMGLSKTMKKDNVLKALNKEIENKSKTSESSSRNHIVAKSLEAIDEFNKHSPFKNKYMAIPYKERTSDGSTVIKARVVERTTTNEDKASKLLYTYNLNDILLSRFIANGININYDHLEEDSDMMIDTMEYFVGEEGVSPNKAGEFIVKALTSDPKNPDYLIARLERHLLANNGAVVKHLLELTNEEYDPNKIREYAAQVISKVLVDKHHKEDLAPKSIVSNLVSKIFRAFKNFISFITRKDFSKYKRKALEDAEALVGRFIEEQLLDNTETTEYNINELDTYDTLLETFRNLVSELKSLNTNISDTVETLYHQLLVDNNLEDYSGEFLKLASAEAIYNVVESLESVLINIQNNAELNFTSVSQKDFYQALKTNAESIQSMSIIAKYIDTVKTILESRADKLNLTSSLGKSTSEIISKLNNLSVHINTQIKNATREHVVTFLKHEYGADYVRLAARKIFKKPLVLENEAAKNMTIEELLDSTSYDLGIWQEWIASLSNCSDITLQIIDMSNKKFKKQAQTQTKEDRDAILNLMERFRELKKKGFVKDTRDLYEVVDGKLTGNLLTEWEYGKWENDLKEFKQSCIKEFKEKHKNWHAIPDVRRALLWDDFYGRKISDWHKTHSEAFGYIRVPNKDKYTNKQYEDLHPEVKDLLRDIIALKRKFDTRLDNEHSSLFRAPQFRGSFIENLRNKNMDPASNTIGNISSILWNRIRYAFVKDGEDYMFGSDGTYNNYDESEDLFLNKSTLSVEAVSRIPLYGINKMKHMEELSTDIFRTMLVYSDMSNKYNSVKNTAKTFEIVRDYTRDKEYLNDRNTTRRFNRFLRKTFGKGDLNLPSSYVRLCKYVDKEIYGKRMSDVALLKSIVKAKVVVLINRLGSAMYLWGNVHGGLANLNQGLVEIMKEAFVGEYFSTEDLRKAIKQYTYYLPYSAVTAGSPIDYNKLDAFVTRYNISDNNDARFKDLRTSKIRPYKMFENMMWLPYKSGDHMMQTLPFLALAVRKQLYYRDSSGEIKTKSLWEAFEDNTLDTELYFNSIDEINKFDEIVKFRDKVINMDIEDLSIEDKDYINSLGIHKITIEESVIVDRYKERLVSDLAEKAEQYHYNAGDDNRFQMKAQELCNRMHGVYNSVDKGVISQYALGALYTSMKNYAIGMIERRFGSNKYSIALDNTVEGSYNTLLKVILSNDYTTLKGWKDFIHSVFLPVFMGDKTKAIMQANGFSVSQFNSMRRCFIDNLTILTLWSLKALLLKAIKGSDDDDDEDKDRKFLQLMYYFTGRVAIEQSAFNTPGGAMDSFFSFGNIVPIGVKAMYELGELAYLGIGQLLYDEDSVENASSIEEKEEAKKNKNRWYYSRGGHGFAKDDSKFNTKLKKKLPYYRSYKSVYEDPVKAFETYEELQSSDRKNI